MQTEFPAIGVSVENVPMGAPKLKPRYAVDEYLALERAAFERHFYVDGNVYAMAGESPNHGVVSANLAGIVVTQLKGKPCQARIKDTKVRSGLAPMTGHQTKGMFSYPDIVVICGEPEYHDAHGDIVLNPRCIIEVLSDSTEAFDRGEKFTRFQTCNPSLTDYVLASQDKAQVEHFEKQTSGVWLYHLYVGLDASVLIASIGCTLNLADVYDRVVFPTEAKSVYEINGKGFTTLEEFYDVISRVLIPDAVWGRNLDAFNDILRGGFGTPEGGFLLHWKNSNVSKERLGYPETVRQLELRLERCHPANRESVASDLEMARKGIGATVFDWLVEIIIIHGSDGEEKEDGVELLLDG